VGKRLSFPSNVVGGVTAFFTLYCLSSVGPPAFVVWECYFGQEAEVVKDDLAAKFQQIRETYLRNLTEARGISQKQIKASTVRRKQCQELIDAHLPATKAKRNPTDLVIMARAAEIVGASDTAIEVSKLLLSVDAGNQDAYEILIRGAINSSNIEAAQKLLDEGMQKLDSPKGLLPFWGILGVQHADHGRPEKAMQCYDIYLDSRYPTGTQSTQLFNVLVPVMESAGWSCLSLKDASKLYSFTDGVEKEMDAIFELRNLTIKPELSRSEFEWAMSFFDARIMLCGFKRNTDDVGKQFQRFLKFANDYEDDEKKLLVELERFEKDGDEESKSELILKAIAIVKRHLMLQQKAKLAFVDSKIDKEKQHEPDQKETLCWFGNDMAFISENWPIFLEIAKRKDNTVVFTYSDAGIEKVLARKVRRLRFKSKAQFEMRLLSAEQEAKFLVPQDVVWLSTRERVVQSCFIGTSPSKVLRALLENE